MRRESESLNGHSGRDSGSLPHRVPDAPRSGAAGSLKVNSAFRFSPNINQRKTVKVLEMVLGFGVRAISSGQLRKAFVWLLLLSVVVLPSMAAAAADASTVEKVESVKLTVEAVFALLITLTTAGIGIKLYRRLGNRAVRTA